jgi:hypothetical protein
VFVRGSSAQQLKEFLRAGRDPSAPASRTGRAMPSFAWLPDETLAQLAGSVRDAARVAD